MIKVVHVIHSLNMAGVELLVLNIIKNSDIKRFKHAVVCLGQDGDVRELYEKLGTSVFVCSLGKLKQVQFFRSIISVEHPDIIHLHRASTPILPQLIQLVVPRKKIVVTEHANYVKSRILGHYFRLLLRGYAPFVFAISQSVAKDLRINNLVSSKVGLRVIYNGIDTSLYEGGGRDLISPVQIGCAGRLVEIKGFGVLLDAVAIMKRKGHFVLLNIAGVGPEELFLKKKAAELGISEYVNFCGSVSDMPTFYREIDVFAQPALQEGFGLTVAEAMCAGRLVVGSSVGGIPEIIEPEVSGFLVPPNDATAIAKTIIHIVSVMSFSDQIKMRKNAKERISSRFSIQQTIREYESAYDQISSYCNIS